MQDLSARQLRDWRQYASQHGLGPRRDDIHHGLLCALIHNAWRGPDAPAAKPVDYMPYHEERPLTQEEFIAQCRTAIAAAKGIAGQN
jgi:hypothetical protein